MRQTPRGVDKDPGWVERRFRGLEQRIAALQTGKLSTVPGAVVTINQVLTTPASIVRDWNTDEATAEADDAAVEIALTHLPLPGSLHVRQNGVDLAPDEWVQVDKLITVSPSAEVIIRDGDRFTTAYRFDAVTPEPVSVPAIPMPVLVGSTSAVDSISSIALPVGAVAGDLFVLAVAGYGGASISDPRVSDSYNASGTLFAWGHLDGTGSPIAVSVSGGAFSWATTCLTVFRGVTVLESDATAQDPDLDGDLTAVTYPDAYAVIQAVIAYDGTIAGSGIVEPTGYMTGAVADSDGKTHARIDYWSSATPTTSPASVYTENTGTPGGMHAYALRLGVNGA